MRGVFLFLLLGMSLGFGAEGSTQGQAREAEELVDAPNQPLPFQPNSLFPPAGGRVQAIWRSVPMDATFAVAAPPITPASLAGPDCVHLASYAPEHAGSVYVPVDSWIYPDIVRLYELGYVDTAFLGLRPWTRRSMLHLLLESQCDVIQGGNEEAKNILALVLEELNDERDDDQGLRPSVHGLESAYARLMGVQGTSLRDSFHLGQTIANDFGRPYGSGFNAIAGFSTIAEAGRFSLYVRGEYQHAPSSTGYSLALANKLSVADSIGPYALPNAPQATIPAGAIAEQFLSTRGS